MNIVDKIIAPFMPERALRRSVARQKLRILNSGYSHHGASTRKKSLIGWISTGASPDEDIGDNLPLLRERSRDLYMGTPIATGALKTIRTNVVGPGLKLNANIDFEFLGLSSDAADAWERYTEREFRLWADTPNCDISRRLTFGQIQGLALLSAMASGDVFATMPMISRLNSTYDLRIALIEGDRVNTPDFTAASKFRLNDRDVRAGIEVNEYGEAIACYIERSHPGGKAKAGEQRAWDRVEFYGSLTGRRNVLHIAQDWERPGQRRGVPLLAPVIETLKQLSRYTEAELMASVVAGMFTVFIKSNSPEAPLGQVVPQHEQVDDDPNAYELGNGAIIGLGDNEDIEVANPMRQNAAFDAFVMSICRQIGVALEIPHELLIKHFTASYSASRAALLEAWKMFRMRRTWLVQTFCQPVYEEWLAEAVAKGRINAPGFFDDPAVRAAWSGADWYGPSQGHLNPLQEANAARVRIEEEISTREREAAEFSGQSWEDIHPVRAREEAARRRDMTIKQPQAFGQDDDSSGGTDND